MRIENKPVNFIIWIFIYLFFATIMFAFFTPMVEKYINREEIKEFVIGTLSLSLAFIVTWGLYNKLSQGAFNWIKPIAKVRDIAYLATAAGVSLSPLYIFAILVKDGFSVNNFISTVSELIGAVFFLLLLILFNNVIVTRLTNQSFLKGIKEMIHYPFKDY